jgi:signal transduction histidine kinase
MLSRRVFWVFVAVVTLVVAELGWWVTYQVREATELSTFKRAVLEHHKQIAVQLILTRARRGPADEGLPGRTLADTFTELVWEPGVPNNRELGRYYPGHRVAIRPKALELIEQERLRPLRMFAAEGVVFLILVLVGAVLVLRALKGDVDLLRQQANFLSAVTHELRSPLTSIRLYTETMALRDPPAEKRKRYLKAIEEDVARLDALVENLLAVARLDKDGTLLRLESVRLEHGVSEFLETMRHELDTRGVAVRLRISDTRGEAEDVVASHEARSDHEAQSVLVRVDRGALRTILRNLIDNALKYGVSNRPEIDVHVYKNGRYGVLDITDYGIGLEPRERERIFRKFYRVGDELVRKAQGSGLGLYLVRALARQGGGDVVAVSPGLGRGTTMRVRLPLARGGLRGVDGRQRKERGNRRDPA